MKKNLRWSPTCCWRRTSSLRFLLPRHGAALVSSFLSLAARAASVLLWTINSSTSASSGLFTHFRALMTSFSRFPAPQNSFVMDAVNGYYQIELDERSSFLTTFLLPCGRNRFLRAPQGCCACSDVWCRESDKVIRGLPFTRKLVDDILVWADTCLLYTSPSPRDLSTSRMPSSA